MPQKVRGRAGALAILATGASLASAVFVVLARLGFDLCDRAVTAAETMRIDGLPGMSHVATAVAGSGDLCPTVLNIALVCAGLAVALWGWLLLSAAAPLVEALALACRALTAAGSAALWHPIAQPCVAAAGVRLARRHPSRAPPSD